MGQYSKFGRILLLALAFLLISSTFAFAITIYVKTDGLDTNDGSTWALAKKTIQAGINTAVSGNEVWVAGGTYVERITLRDGVKLYGGYSGVGTTRDSALYVTTIDGNQAGTVVTTPSGATSTTRLNGFIIRNGKASSYGGGIYCSSSSPTLTNNTITGNTATYGGGIYCSSSSPTIENNTISGNSGSYYGGGVYCDSSSPMITNNTITGNSAPYFGGAGICCSSSSPMITNNAITGNSGETGGGIYCYYYSSPTITNNTITANSGSPGGGIYCDYYSSPALSNNIVALNSSGVCQSRGGSSALRNNCVYGNTGYNYSGVVAGTGDISADPKLVAVEYGKLHVKPGSPCIEAGYNGAPGLPAADMDGDARILPGGGTVDIGADEYSGTPPGAFTPVIVRVTPSGNDANDGSAWDDAHAKRTVQAGIDQGSLLGGEVWVAGGTYSELIALTAYAYLYGGFAGTEISRNERNWVSNITIFDGAGRGGVVQMRAPGYGLTAIDGFTIRNGAGAGFGGIFCSSSSPTIANNIITANSGNPGGGIYCASSSPVIISNTISGNNGVMGGGILCDSSSPTIINNTITANSAAWWGGGIYCNSSSPVIAGNTINGNSAESGGGVYCDYSSSPIITNNTITANSGAPGGGVYCYYASPAVSNNIVAFNSSGICKYSTSGVPVLKNNCVYGNTSYNYSGLPAGTGAISTDPKLVAVEYGKVHIQPDSPCRDAGDDSAVQPGWLDMDGQARVQGAHVDIGADETDGTQWIFTPIIVRVRPAGNDSNDGSSWASAKKTVQAGINAASAVGGEVWVAAGTYNQRITLGVYAYLFGGFAATEDFRSERDWIGNVTILDGGGAGSAVVQARVPGYGLSGIDGFTIRKGMGIFCSSSSPTISNNVITANSDSGISCTTSSPAISNNIITANMTEFGGGLFCYRSSPIVANNSIVGNNASRQGGGICCSFSSPAITNNTILRNSSSSGGGIYCYYSAAGISNNVVAFNSSGVYNDGNAPNIRNNDVFGNTGYDYSWSPQPTGTNGNISVDPQFLAQQVSDYHLLPWSPCVNAGDDSAVLPGSTDLDGKQRILGAHVDMGCFEWDTTPYWIRQVGQAKAVPEGLALELRSKPVTAAFAGACYVEEPDRSSGLRILWPTPVAVGDFVTLSGQLTLDGGERALQAASFSVVSHAESLVPKPFAMPNLNLGGGDYQLASDQGQQGVRDFPEEGWHTMYSRALNNIGLLVTVWGNVTCAGTGEFWIDDGSALNDGSGHIGVKVSAPGYTIPTSGFVIVTGVSSCEKTGDDLVRLLRVRNQADIVPL